jgi:hypothetical protein
MYRYLKAAFLVRPRVPGLGALPVNVLSAVVFLAMGFAMPFLWPLGAGLIGAFCFVLASTPRFRRLVDAIDQQRGSSAALTKRADLIASLDSEARQRLATLMQRCGRVLDSHRRTGADEFSMRTTGEALDRLQWVYLKLLIARQTLADRQDEIDGGQLRVEAASIEKELTSEKLSPSMRQSRQATLDLLNKRLESLSTREQTAAEIDSDLRRVEAQVDVALDEATMNSAPTAINVNIELASQLMDASIYGNRSDAIADLDQTFGTSQEAIRN